MRRPVLVLLVFLFAVSPALATTPRTGRAADGTVFRLSGRTLTIVLAKPLPGTPSDVARLGWQVFCGTTRANVASSKAVRARTMRTLVARLDRTPIRSVLTCGLESKSGHDLETARLPAG